MNSIKGKLDQSDYEIYDDYLNFQIDGYWLDEKLDDLYPGKMYKGLVPTLLFWLEGDREREIVWQRILPAKHQKAVCPVLMCPDDCDFTCTVIVAEVENCDETIRWSRIGLDLKAGMDKESVGSKVDWFKKIYPLQFKTSEYLEMLQNFRRHYDEEKGKWEEKNKKS